MLFPGKEKFFREKRRSVAAKTAKNALHGGYGCEVIDLERESAERALLEKIGELAFCRCNDAVKLAFLGEDALKKLDRLDLGALTEFHRLSNGTVELKFLDRVKLLELMERITAGSGETGAAELLSAIDSAADRLPRRTEEDGHGALS